MVPLRIPPLRERREDVPLLAITSCSASTSGPAGDKLLSPEALAQLLEHEWPGNVRELENMIEQAAALSPAARDSGPPTPPEHLPSAGRGGSAVTLAQAVEDAERRAIEATLSAATVTSGGWPARWGSRRPRSGGR